MAHDLAWLAKRLQGGAPAGFLDGNDDALVQAAIHAAGRLREDPIGKLARFLTQPRKAAKGDSDPLREAVVKHEERLSYVGRMDLLVFPEDQSLLVRGFHSNQKFRLGVDDGYLVVELDVGLDLELKIGGKRWRDALREVFGDLGRRVLVLNQGRETKLRAAARDLDISEETFSVERMDADGPVDLIRSGLDAGMKAPSGRDRWTLLDASNWMIAVRRMQLEFCRCSTDPHELLEF